jgi:hypothetical protein
MNKILKLEEIEHGSILELSYGMLRLDGEDRGVTANAKSFSVSDGEAIGIVTLGIIPPASSELALGNSLSVWNFYVVRDENVSSNIATMLEAIESYASAELFDSIFITSNFNLTVPARKSGYIIRESLSPDIKYSTKRLR